MNSNQGKLDTRDFFAKSSHLTALPFPRGILMAVGIAVYAAIGGTRALAQDSPTAVEIVQSEGKRSQGNGRGSQAGGGRVTRV